MIPSPGKMGFSLRPVSFVSLHLALEFLKLEAFSHEKVCMNEKSSDSDSVV